LLAKALASAGTVTAEIIDFFVFEPATQVASGVQSFGDILEGMSVSEFAVQNISKRPLYKEHFL